MYPYIFVAVSLFFSVTAQAQNFNAESIAAHLSQAFRQNNIALLQNDLSPDFSVAAYTYPSADNCLKRIIHVYGCDSVIVNRTNGKLQAVFYNNGKAKDTGKIKLDSAGKILYIDTFDRLYGMNRNAHSRLLVKVPFETDAKGAVYLLVKLNNSSRTLKLLFDTGADGMALRESLADSISIKPSRTQSTSVVGGNMKIAVSEGNTVHLDTFSIPNQSIALFKEMRGNMDGIIGNSLAKLFITKVDYDKKEFSLYNFGDYQYTDNGHAVPVTMPAGAMIIPGTIAITKDKPYNGKFIFDLGAAYGLICFRPFVKQHRLLVDGFVPELQASTTSMGITTPTFSGKAAYFKFSNMHPIDNMTVTLMSGGGQRENWNPGFDGSIGTGLISHYNFVINMQKKEIWFSPNKKL